MSPRAGGALYVALVRVAAGIVAIAAAWVVGLGVDAATGLPDPVAGLVVLAAVLVAWPAALDVVAPVADAVVRLLPLLFIPAVVAVAAVEGDVAIGAAIAAVVVSVPVAFGIAARLAR